MKNPKAIGNEYERKKPSRKTLKKKCDKVWGEIIRSKKYCEICGRPANNPHHVIGRVNYILRWDIRNGCLLCAGCHTSHRFSAHNDPVYFMDWFKKHRPKDYDYLIKKKNKIWDKNYEEILKKLKIGENKFDI